MVTRQSRRRGSLSLLLIVVAILCAGAADNETARPAAPATPLEAEAERTLREAERLMDAGRDEQADGLLKGLAQRLEQAAAENPRDARVQHLLGRAHAYRGRDGSAAALVAFKRAAELDPADGKSRVLAGTLAMEAGDEAEAMEWFKKAAAAEPTYATAHYNVGQVYQIQGKFQESLDAFRAALKLRPDDDRARAKVIQNLQALGRTDERERERQALLKLFRDGKVGSGMYCREQFTVGKEKVMAFEYFELKGERAVRYAFNVLDDTGSNVKYRITLGSYATTTAVARQTGKIGKDERLFHLDGYYEGGEHRTFGFYDKEPTYDEARKLACAAIEGKLAPVSRSRPRQGGADVELPQPE